MYNARGVWKINFKGDVMNIELLDFLAVYSLPTLIIAVIASVIKIVCGHYLTDKIGKGFISIIPFAIALVLNFAYDCIFVKKAFYFGEETLTAGLIGGSLASLFSAIFDRIKSGKLSDLGDGVKLVLEGILKNYVRADLLMTATIKVKDLIEADSENLENNHDELVGLIADTLKEYSEDGITDDEIKAVADLAVKAVKQLKTR